MAQTVKRLPTIQETWVQSLGQEDLLEKKMAIHFSILAWKIPWTEEPGRLQSMGSYESDRTKQLHFHFLAVQWLRLCTSKTGGMGSVPGQETKIPHGMPKKPFSFKRCNYVISSKCFDF